MKTGQATFIHLIGSHTEYKRVAGGLWLFECDRRGNAIRQYRSCIQIMCSPSFTAGSPGVPLLFVYRLPIDGQMVSRHTLRGSEFLALGLRGGISERRCWSWTEDECWPSRDDRGTPSELPLVESRVF